MKRDQHFLARCTQVNGGDGVSSSDDASARIAHTATKNKPYYSICRATQHILRCKNGIFCTWLQWRQHEKWSKEDGFAVSEQSKKKTPFN